jgi:hypothetical protein
MAGPICDTVRIQRLDVEMDNAGFGERVYSAAKMNTLIVGKAITGLSAFV